MRTCRHHHRAGEGARGEVVDGTLAVEVDVDGDVRDGVEDRERRLAGGGGRSGRGQYGRGGGEQDTGAEAGGECLAHDVSPSGLSGPVRTTSSSTSYPHYRRSTPIGCSDFLGIS